MKYVAYWLGSAAALTLGALVLYAGWLLLESIRQDPNLRWVTFVALGIFALATIVAVVEYITDRRREEPPVG